MLAPGLAPGTRWQEKLSLSPSEALAWRRYWLKKARANPRVRQALLDECAQDLLLWVNLFVFTYDPRRQEKSIPFMTYPFQDRALLTILDALTPRERGSGRAKAENLVVQKSRDMGASWMCLLAMLWCWRFHAGMSFLMVSRKEELVDSAGDMDALFPKLDFVLHYLPEWLLPAGWEARKHRLKLHFENPANGSIIDGESTTSASGVGGRRTAVFVDEFSRIEEGYQLQAGLADVTDCVIYNFTPWGAANASYKLAQRARRGEIRNLELHWSEHPEKARGLYRYSEQSGRVEILDRQYVFPETYPFVHDGKLRSVEYDYEWKRRNNPREMAQMWDIDYAGSAYLYFDKATIAALQHEYGQPPWWEGDLQYDRDSGQPLRLVKVEGGPLKLWCRLDHDQRPPLCPYGGGADVSQGTGTTNSVFSIANRTTGEKVLELATPYLRPEQFAALVVALCRFFKAADGETTKLCWERQGPGVTFGKMVRELGYRHFYGQRNELKSYGNEDPDQPGWFPSNDNRRLLLDEYRAALSAREFLNRSRQALEECCFYVNTARGTVEHSQAESGFSEITGEQDPSGARSNHGDRVIADALCWKMCKESGEQRPARKNPRQAGPPLLSLDWRREYNSRKEKEAEDEEWT